MRTIKLFAMIFITLLVISCKNKPKEELTKAEETITDTTSVVAIAPEWSKNAVIYEVNIRQYTKEGTINAFSQHLPRLKNLGIDILWIMPPFPVGIKNRKGKMGSPYSISDYSTVNPDFGTEEDFRKMVAEAHKLGMKVIVDWVANHSSFDNKWTVSNPEWYTKDSLGKITHPKDTDWTDVADLNYDNKEMRAEMIKMMNLWITKFDIDGFRCDVAGMVPVDFWKDANESLNKTKEVFMLAEAEEPPLHYAGFHMTYGWELHHLLNEIAQGKTRPEKIDTFLVKDKKRFPAEAYRMNFTENHDENSWKGTVKERMGKAGDVMTVIAFTIQGMPLVYSGQEAGLDKRLSFFEKDQIDWRNLSKSDFFKKLIGLHKTNQALWNGHHGSPAVRIKTDNGKIYAFSRTKDSDEVIVITNLSSKSQKFNVTGEVNKEIFYFNIMTRESKKMSEWLTANKELKPWDYLVLEKKK
ncbi:MAG: alpha-amylase family glycosyl hydrolase [Deltaproteobacteria bacterium]